ncbi:hypothetical protein R1flu_016152 [Riccia fluitans]|uniref:Reverse transcriptase zinc-binding domain-containing protein n=1 Tax=Riccia fluitans TaxID=41844 RepID=A0ABD1YL16_9MARC
MISVVLPGSLTLWQIQELMRRYRNHKPFNERIVYPLLKRLGVTTLINLKDCTGNWIKVAAVLETCGFQLNAVQLSKVEAFQNWLREVRLGVQSLEESPSWRWEGTDNKWNGWLKPSNFWHRLLESQEITDDLSAKWPDGCYELTWKTRWKKLWGRGGLTRTKLWTWRLLRRAFSIGERAKAMQVAQGTCVRCKANLETTRHLFYECSYSQAQWRQLRSLADRARVSFWNTYDLLRTIDKAISTKTKGGMLVYILFSITNTLWKDRNLAVFHNRLQETPLRVSLIQARVKIEGSFNSKSPKVHWQQGLRMLEEINRLIELSNCLTSSVSEERDSVEGLGSQRRTPTSGSCSQARSTLEAPNE